VHLDPAVLWDDAVTTVGFAAGRAGLIGLHAWTAEQADALAAVVDGRKADALTALPLLLAVLGDTGRLSGTPAQLVAAIAAAEEATSPVA
jgi:hypothetical protein